MALWADKDLSGKFPKFLPVGRVLVIKVTNGGTGYTNGATQAVTIAAPGGGGITATATANVVGGIVTSITMVQQGSKYTTLPVISAPAGAGSNFAAVAVLEPVIYDSAKIFFVDATEAAQASNKAKGIHSAGWWYLHSYVDSSGDTRYKSECFVATGTTAAVAGDLEDTVMLDSSVEIAFSLQPLASSVALGTVLSIAVTNGGTGYTNGAAQAVALTAPPGGGVQATATALVSGGIVQSITVTNPGSGYLVAPTVSAPAGAGSNFAATSKINQAVFTATAAGVPSGSVTYQWQVAAAGTYKYVNIGGATTATLTVTGLVIGDNGKKYRVKASLVGSADKVSQAVILTVS